MATDSLFKITKSVCENDYTICHWDECYAKPKKIKYVLHVEKKND